MPGGADSSTCHGRRAPRPVSRSRPGRLALEHSRALCKQSPLLSNGSQGKAQRRPARAWLVATGALGDSTSVPIPVPTHREEPGGLQTAASSRIQSFISAAEGESGGNVPHGFQLHHRVAENSLLSDSRAAPTARQAAERRWRGRGRYGGPRLLPIPRGPPPGCVVTGAAPCPPAVTGGVGGALAPARSHQPRTIPISDHV